MGKAGGSYKRRRKNTFNYNRRVRRIRKKQLKMSTINCKELKEAWDSSKSYKKNMDSVGLSFDPNQTIDVKGKNKKKAIRMDVVNKLESKLMQLPPKK
ncbi:nucleolar protein 16 [Nephila pilipes]|uniref:Nucleolar protein 16 n=1 Tax=Nephila pilipes TaxID=299642 RepID=A0A8X6MYA9_NEPPI|nr:nucleolar protein 16 [Nephila pilipes]